MAWSYEQKFNTLNDGDLNGQDSWTGNGWQIQTTNKYEGAKGVAAEHTTSDFYADRTITGISDGVVYLAMMRGTRTGDSNFRFILQEGANQVADFWMRNDNKVYYHDGSLHELGTFTDSVWGVVKITFDGSTDKIKYKWHNGTSWGTETDWVNAKTAFTNIDNLEIASGWSSPGTYNDYFDTLTPTDPTGGGAVSTLTSLRLTGVGN